jgi:hypothetical protein
MTDFTQLISYASALSVLLPLVFFFQIKGILRKKLYVLLGGLLVFGGLMDLITLILRPVLLYRSVVITNFFFIFQFILISLIFVQVCRSLREIAKIVGAAYLLFAIINGICCQPVTTFQSYNAVLEDIIFVIYCFVFLRYLLKDLAIINLLHYPAFWIVTGIFFYSILSLYLFILAGYVFARLPQEYGVVLWTFHDGVNIVENGLFATAFFFAGKKVKRQEHEVKESVAMG